MVSQKLKKKSSEKNLDRKDFFSQSIFSEKKFKFEQPKKKVKSSKL